MWRIADHFLESCCNVHYDSSLFTFKTCFSIESLYVVCLGCAEIQLRTKETPNGIDATCQPGRHVVNIYRRWSICLSDGECIYIWHPVTGVNLTMSEELEIMLILHPVKSSDKAFIATLMHGNGSASNNTAGNITLSCGVKLSDGLNWSPSVQISLQFTSVPPTENTTVLSNPGETIGNLYMCNLIYDITLIFVRSCIASCIYIRVRFSKKKGTIQSNSQ